MGKIITSFNWWKSHYQEQWATSLFDLTFAEPIR